MAPAMAPARPRSNWMGRRPGPDLRAAVTVREGLKAAGLLVLRLSNCACRKAQLPFHMYNPEQENAPMTGADLATMYEFSYAAIE